MARSGGLWRMQTLIENFLRLREKLLFAFCYFSLLSQLFSIQVVHALELRVTLHSRHNFSRFSHGRTDARGECKGQVDRTEEINK